MTPSARALHIASTILYGIGMVIGFAGAMLLIASSWIECEAIDHEVP
jgi:hypothetical protein